MICILVNKEYLMCSSGSQPDNRIDSTAASVQETDALL